MVEGNSGEDRGRVMLCTDCGTYWKGTNVCPSCLVTLAPMENASGDFGWWGCCFLLGLLGMLIIAGCEFGNNKDNWRQVQEQAALDTQATIEAATIKYKGINDSFRNRVAKSLVGKGEVQ